MLIPAFAVAPVSVECEMHYIARDQPIALLLAVFVLVEVGSHIAGVTFDASTLPGTWQFLDESLLVNDLGRSLWYLHAQPPAFNLFLGIVLKLAARHAALVFHFAYVAMGWALCSGVFRLAEMVGATRPVAIGAALLVTVSPSFVLYEHWLFYTLPEAALLMWMAIGAGTLARNVTPTHALRFSTNPCGPLPDAKPLSRRVRMCGARLCRAGRAAGMARASLVGAGSGAGGCGGIREESPAVRHLRNQLMDGDELSQDDRSGT